MKILALLFLLVSACSKKEEPVLYTAIYEMVRAEDDSIHEVLIQDPSKRVLCDYYGPNCMEKSGKRLKVRSLELVLIGFKTEEDARREAVRLGQYYYKNWLFDEVKDEPVLESFIQKVFKAKFGQKRPTDVVQ